MIPDDRLKKRIRASATTCAYCGHAVPPSAWKCENCGSRVATPNQWVPKAIVAAIVFGFLFVFLA